MLRRSGGSSSVSSSSLANIPAGNISSTTIQDAINELDTEKVAANTAITAGTTPLLFKPVAYS